MTRGRATWILLLLGTLLSLLSLWRFRTGMSRPDPAADTVTPSHGGEGGAPPPRKPPARPSPPQDLAAAPPVTPGSGCWPRASRACSGGDVHWLDSCGQPGGKVQECGPALCRDGACAETDPQACEGLGMEGRCDGEVVVGCVGGQPFARDCAALGMRCVRGEEGAECRAPHPDDCAEHGPLPRCERGVLLGCVDGHLRRTACADHDARCAVLVPGAAPSCVHDRALAAAPRADPVCGPCGCSHDAIAASPEQCDGRDDDGDGVVDEAVDCGEIPLVAYIVTDNAGRGSYERADIVAEVARVNSVLASAPEGLRLQASLRDVRELRHPEWSSLEDDELGDLFALVSLGEAGDGFHVPVVFTDSLERGETPKVGLSTLPNGHCGGRRVSAHPEPNLGGIAVAKGRGPATVAHELGHYLGLCHTHFDYDPPVTEVVHWPAGDDGIMLLGCDDPCRAEGDGVCDTPDDPGPPDCLPTRQCTPVCSVGADPDVTNAMSYYGDCRTHLSVEQARLMRRGLWLQQGFQRCRAAGACPCDPTGDGCPEQMVCRPGELGFGCGLQGPLPEGAACAAHAECGDGTLCASDGTCRRACQPATTRCHCVVDAGLGLRVCG